MTGRVQRKHRSNRGRQAAEERRRTLAELSDIIETNERIFYDYGSAPGKVKSAPKDLKGAPDGLEPGAPQEYGAMIRAATTIHAAAQCALRIVGPQSFLDDPHWRGLLDPSGVLTRLGKWHQHVRTMWKRADETGLEFRERHPRAKIESVNLYGLGGSAAPHDIVREVIENLGRSGTPIRIVRADTPHLDCVTPNTLAILASFSGNTAETLRCLELVNGRTRLLAAITRGGELRCLARKRGIPFVQITDDPQKQTYVWQPRESVCLQAIASLVFLARIGLLPGSEGSLDLAYLNRKRNGILCLLAKCREQFGPSVPFGENPAKRLALFALGGRSSSVDGTPEARPPLAGFSIPYLLGDRNLRAVIHEAATQFRERSKMNVVEGVAPEDLHNSVESIRASVESAGPVQRLLAPFTFIFFESGDAEPPIALRLRVTRSLVLRGKADYAVVRAEGENPLERALFLTYFNAHMTTYAAILNGFDPLPVPTMSWLKNVMRHPTSRLNRVTEPPFKGVVGLF